MKLRPLLGALALVLACAPAAPRIVTPPPPPISTPPAPPAEKPGPILALTTSCALLRTGEIRCFRPVPALEERHDLVTLTEAGDATWALDRAGAAHCFGCKPEDEKALADIGPITSLAVGWGVVARDAGGNVWHLHDGSVEPVPQVAGAVEVAAGDDRACARFEDGHVRCWEPLGDKTTKPREVPGLDDAVALAGGRWHVCALRRGGRVICWGANDRGILGAPSRKGETQASPDIDDAVSIAGTGFSTCAVRRSGRVFCWGRSIALASSRAASGGLEVGLDDAEHVAASETLVCASTRAGVVRCVGDLPPHAPEPVVGLRGATAIAAGYAGTCALTGGGDLQCWGVWKGGEEPWSAERVPRPVHGMKDAIQLAMSTPQGRSLDGCVTRRQGEVVCWSGAATSSPGVSDATAVSLGQYHACALRRGGTVSCWGRNDSLQLGRVGPDSNTATPVPGLTGVVHVAAAASTSCALDARGVVRCWGNNLYGELGPDRSIPKRAAPRPVPGVAIADGLVGGYDFFCAHHRDGRVTCWGFNFLDPPTGPDSPNTIEPGPLGLGDVQHIAAGTGHLCVIQKGGAVSCLGGRDPFISPVLADAGSLAMPGATDLAVGDDHVCVLLAGGEVRCWGDDEYGQLGQGGGALGGRQVLDLR